MTGTLAASVSATAERCAQVLTEVERVIVGKREAVAQVLLGILASGHILIEDLPGLGKTLLARTFATTLGLEFTRVQFTPDMLPADLTGAPVLDPATDNPIEYEGTYPLPEAQLDRFIARIRLGYLDEPGEAEMARRRLERGSAPPRPAEVLNASALLAMRESLEQVHLDDDLLGYVVRLVATTRSHPQVTVGASPRGTLAVIQLARGHAALDSRDYVIPEDIKAVAVPALAHRLVLRPEMWVRKVTGEDLISEILTAEPVPRASR